MIDDAARCLWRGVADTHPKMNPAVLPAVSAKEGRAAERIVFALERLPVVSMVRSTWMDTIRSTTVEVGYG